MQYQNEERSLIRRRISVSLEQLKELIYCMQQETLSMEVKIKRLAKDLAKFHEDDSFKSLDAMSEILLKHLNKRLKMNINV